MPHFPLSGFADEIGPDPKLQVETLKRLGIGGIDVRGMDERNVLQLGAFRLDNLKQLCEKHGIRIQSIGSPVNKVPMTPDHRKNEMAKLAQAIEAARILGTKRIRIFSPETNVGDNDDVHWPEIKSWMAEMVAAAEASEVMLIHENDGKFFGAYPKNCKRLLEEFSGPHFRAVFDFANSVLIGYRSMDDWFPWLLPHLDTLHIKDARQVDGSVVVAGEGDGQMVETIKWLIAEGWMGPLTLEPHLKAVGSFGGFSGPELFEEAVQALRWVVEEAGGTC